MSTKHDGERLMFVASDEEDTPSCETCGGPLHTADEVFSEECDECFKKFVEADLPVPTTKDLH